MSQSDTIESNVLKKAANLESIHEPVSDTKESNVLTNESETVDDNSLEDRPAVVGEVGASHYNPKKIANIRIMQSLLANVTGTSL